MALTPEQVERLKEIKVDFDKAWRNADTAVATERDVAYAKLETISALAYIFDVDQ